MASVVLQEKANFTRLARLLVDKGTEALRTTFDSIHPPANLSTDLNSHTKSLLTLKFKIINASQWDLLYPPPGNPPVNSKSFDVTLLTVLLRNICGLPAPTTGWDVMPLDTDRSVSANIARIKLLRNEVYAHVTSTQVDNATFETLWQEIAQALVDLKIPQNDIDELRTSTLGPEEETYVDTLEEWKMKDDECLEVLKLSMNRLTALIEESRDELKQLHQSALQQQNDDAKSMKLSMNRLTTLTEESRNEMKQLHQSVSQQQNDEIKSMMLSLNRLTTLIEESRDEMKQLHQSVLQQQNDDVTSMKLAMNRLSTLTEESRDEMKRIRQSVLQQQNDQAKEINQNSITRSSQVTAETKFEKNCSKGSDEDILQKLAKYNFGSKIQRKVNFFLPGTREWLLKELNDWFTRNEPESRLLLLTAGPGFGKSVFAAKVCEDFKDKEKLAACHLCDCSDSNLRNPMMMLQSLASQMCENVVGFKEELLDQLKRPHQVKTLKDAFGIYLQNPLNQLALKEPILVVIDGLDESAADNKNEIVDLIASYFPDLPQCVKVLVTSRPEISVAKLSHLQKINVGTADSKNDSDLKLYLKDCLRRLAERNETFFDALDDEEIDDFSIFDMLVRKCQGSFLYAFHLQSELNKRYDLSNMTCSEIEKILPAGLGSIFQKYFKRFENELKEITDTNVDVLPILQMLVASRSPLPLTFIARALGLAPDCRDTRKMIDRVNEAVSCLLYVSDGQVTVFHKSVIDWLLANGFEDHEYVVKSDDGYRLLWPMCETILKKIKETVCSGQGFNPTLEMNYALNGLEYLHLGKMKETFFWLVDLVILHAVFILDEHSSEIRYNFLRKLWRNLLTGDVAISDKVRKRISWYISEIDYLQSQSHYTTPFPFLESILTCSPKGYFSDDERAIAKSILSKGPQFVELEVCEPDIIPLAVKLYEGYHFVAFGVSLNTKIAAVADKNGGISVLSLPRLVELWQYSTEYSRISHCTFGPDGSFILFGRLGTKLDIAERKEVPFFHGNEETFTCCAFSPNGKRLVTSDGSDTVKLWDVAKQSLLTSLDAAVPVNSCAFSCTGLFIISGEVYSFSPEAEEADSVKEDEGEEADLFDEDEGEEADSFDEDEGEEADSFDEDEAEEADSFDEDEAEKADSFCAWSAITWQRSDERNLHEEILEERGALRGKTCRRCLRPGKSKPTRKRDERYKILSMGTYNGVECIFVMDGLHLMIIETTHFTTLAVWDLGFCPSKIIALQDNLWLFLKIKEIILFETRNATQEQSCLPRPTCVVSSSFSPDGSRLATCTSDGYINIWNVNTSQVDQRFKSNHGQTSFACWWSKNFLFVFDVVEWTPRFSKYPVNDGLKIHVTQRQQVSLCHVVNEFVDLSAILDFSEGILSFQCGKMKPVKVLDVSEVGETRMLTLPEIEPGMRINVSQGASFIFGAKECNCFIWKRIAKEPAVYKVLFHYVYTDCNLCWVFSFSNESTHAIVVYDEPGKNARLGLIDWVTCQLETSGMFRNSYIGDIYIDSPYNLFGFAKERIIIMALYRTLQFVDIDSGSLLYCSIKRNLAKKSSNQTKLSPKGTVIALPKFNGDMEFVRLCIPQGPELARIKREAVKFSWNDCAGPGWN